MNYHEILGVNEDASYEEIARSFRIFVKKYHLEKNKLPGATTKFFKVYQAFTQLNTGNQKDANAINENETEYVKIQREKTVQAAEICSGKLRKNKVEELLIKAKAAAMLLLLGAALVFAPFVYEHFHTDMDFYKATGFMSIPGIPDSGSYDAILIGENHMSAQNYDIELDLIKYYYSQGIRDFVLECGFADALFIQYYFDTGDEECLEYLFRISGSALSPLNSGRVIFYRNIRQWNSHLDEKIRIHGFDIEHHFQESGGAAIWFFILRKYEDLDDIPFIKNAPGSFHDFTADFYNNSERYSSLDPEDRALLERIIFGINQKEAYNYLERGPSKRKIFEQRAIYREQAIIENFREILVKTGGRKVLAIMGYYHSSLTGNAKYLLSEMQFPSVSTNQSCLANVLKDEIKIASIVLRSVRNSKRWPYYIRIQGWELTGPHISPYVWGRPYR